MTNISPTYLELTKEIIQFKSISTDPAFADECKKTADWLEEKFTERGFSVETLQGPTCNPVVVARYMVDSQLETVMIYGHYDVQPATVENGWSSDPFTLTEKEGRLIARGAIDNKGQFMVHVATVFDLIAQEALGYNIVFMIEGNEETGNPDMPQLVRDHAALLDCDHIMISDGETLKDLPTMELALRGGGNMTVTLTTGKNNLHSGLYGGAVPNATHEMTKLLATLFTDDHRVAVEGFYEGVDEIPQDIRDQNAALLPDDEAAQSAGVEAIVTEGGGYDFLTQVGLRPTLQITGVNGGYTGEGYSNIVVAKAVAKINLRTVKSQNEKAVAEAIKQHLLDRAPAYAQLDIEIRDPYSAVKVDASGDIVKKIMVLLEGAHSHKVVTKYCGGGIPIVGDFQEILGKETLLVSFANEDCNMHGVDENFTIDLLQKSLKFSRAFFERG